MSNVFPSGYIQGSPASGLTKRELFAAMAMQAIAGKAGTPANQATYQHWTQISCKWADALLEALSQD